MKIRSLLFTVFGMLLLTQVWATKHTITNSGFVFVPAELNVTVGDTVVFNIGSTHNAVEVSQATYDARGTEPNGGFNVPFGGGEIVITEAKTYYYVCQPHVGLDMVGTIVATNGAAEGEVFVAQLSGANEVLPVLSGGTGSVTATLDGDMLTVEGSFSGLRSDFNADIGAHIHLGYAGQNGGIAFPLNPTLDGDNRGGIFEASNNTLTLNAEQVSALRARQMYVNIHSIDNPMGELRGQLLSDADAHYGVNLFGSNEVPSIITGAAGALALEVIGDSLFVTGSFDNLEGDIATDIVGGAHLHIGSAGENGGVEFPLVITADADARGGVFMLSDNGFALSESQKMMLANRMIYANIHSGQFRSGEIRGQVRSMSDAVFRAHLSGSNEAPPVTTAATGEVVLELNGNTLTVSGSFQGLAGDLATDIRGGAHLHLAVAGRNGGILYDLTVTQDGDSRSGRFLPADNEFTLTDEERMALMNREIYVNIHSEAFRSGELRGQVVPESQFFFTGFLTGMQEPDPVLSGGSGAVIAEIMGNNLTLTGSFNNMNDALATNIRGGSHIHMNIAGANGPIAFDLAATQGDDITSGVYLPADNTFELNDSLLGVLKARRFYVNIHSFEVTSGELRAQLLHESTAYFFAPLSSTSEAPPARSGAFGAVILEWNAGQLLASGSFSNLESAFNRNVMDGAHIHLGYPGQNGGIVLPLAATTSDGDLSGTFELMDNMAQISAGFPDTVLARRLYVNIHSTDIPSGELRGQVMPYANAYFTATLSGANEVQPVASGGNGAFKFELNGNQLTATGSFQNLDGAFDPNVAGGSHLHNGIVGENAGFDISLNVSLAEDSLSGVYLPSENTFMLDEDKLMRLMNGGLYVNIHTKAVTSGELRGQVLPETNQFPDPSNIAAPPSGAMLEVAGAGETAFEANWNAAADPDGNNVAYIWQLAADASFDNPVLAVNTGADTAFVTDFATVSSLLSGVGVEVGQTVKLYHRVLTSDGSLQTASPADSVSLMLGVVTDVDDAVIKQMTIKTYPNPATDQVQLSVSSVENLQGTIVLIDGMGRVLKQREVQFNVGENREVFDVQSYDTGLYFLQLWIENRLAGTERLLIQR